MVSIVAFVFLLIFKKRQNASVADVLCVIGVLVFSLLILMLGGVLSPGYYTKWVIFAFALLFYLVTLRSDEDVSDGIFKLLFLSVVVQSAFFVFQSFDDLAYVELTSGTFIKFCFDNKNSAAMHLLTLCCISVLYAERLKTKQEKFKIILPLITFAICFYFILKTGSRSSLIGAIFILPFFIAPSIKKYITRPILLLFVLSPFIFAVIYIALYKAGFGDLQFLGRKIFNGREELWIPVFEGNLYNWMFGMFSQFTRPDGIPFQLHNGIIDLIASYGSIVTIAFLTMIYKSLAKLLDTKNNTNRMVVICICALIFQSIGEAALFNGTRAIYICMILAFIERKTNNDIFTNNKENTKDGTKYFKGNTENLQKT